MILRVAGVITVGVEIASQVDAGSVEMALPCPNQARLFASLQSRIVGGASGLRPGRLSFAQQHGSRFVREIANTATATCIPRRAPELREDHCWGNGNALT